MALLLIGVLVAVTSLFASCFVLCLGRWRLFGGAISSEKSAHVGSQKRRRYSEDDERTRLLGNDTEEDVEELGDEETGGRRGKENRAGEVYETHNGSMDTSSGIEATLEGPKEKTKSDLSGSVADEKGRAAQPAIINGEQQRGRYGSIDSREVEDAVKSRPQLVAVASDETKEDSGFVSEVKKRVVQPTESESKHGFVDTREIKPLKVAAGSSVETEMSKDEPIANKVNAQHAVQNEERRSTDVMTVKSHLKPTPLEVGFTPTEPARDSTTDELNALLQPTKHELQEANVDIQTVFEPPPVKVPKPTPLSQLSPKPADLPQVETKPVPLPQAVPKPVSLPQVEAKPAPLPQLSPKPAALPQVETKPVPLPQAVPKPVSLPQEEANPTPLPQLSPKPAALPQVETKHVQLPQVVPEPVSLPQEKTKPTLPHMAHKPVPLPQVSPNPTAFPRVAPKPAPRPRQPPDSTSLSSSVPPSVSPKPAKPVVQPRKQPFIPPGAVPILPFGNRGTPPGAIPVLPVAFGSKGGSPLAALRRKTESNVEDNQLPVGRGPPQLGALLMGIGNGTTAQRNNKEAENPVSFDEVCRYLDHGCNKCCNLIG